MKSNVYFSDLRTRNKQNLLQKIDLLLTKVGVHERVGKSDLTAIKIHFGERGNTAYVRPLFVQRVVQRLRQLEARPQLLTGNRESTMWSEGPPPSVWGYQLSR